MKIISNLMLMFLLGFFLFVAEARAGYYSYVPNPPDLYGLDHSKYYKWGISVDSSSPEIDRINGARLSISDIWDSESGINYLSVHLLDNPTSIGVTVYSDTNDGIDKFPLSTLLKQWSNISHNQSSPDDLYYDFSPDNLGMLISYMKTYDKFGLGFDPDCHFYNNGIKLEIWTAEAAVPEPATMILLGTGLLGFAGVRRHRKNIISEI